MSNYEKYKYFMEGGNSSSSESAAEQYTAMDDGPTPEINVYNQVNSNITIENNFYLGPQGNEITEM